MEQLWSQVSDFLRHTTKASKLKCTGSEYYFLKRFVFTCRKKRETLRLVARSS